MASAVNRCGVYLVRHSFRARPSFAVRQLGRPAQFHRSACRRDDEPEKQPDKVAAKPSKVKKQSAAATTESKEPDEVVDYGEVEEDDVPREGFLGFRKGMTRDEKNKELAAFRSFLADPPADAKEAVDEYKRGWAKLEQDAQRQLMDDGDSETLDIPDNFMEARFVPGLFAEGEDVPEEDGEDDMYEGDDMTSLAHGELEQHREIREYMRIASWEMPLLSKYAKKFELPGNDRPLRFRYTSYMGESHPAEKKVVVEFCTADLPLTPQQRLKLIKLLGPRYDPQEDRAKMSCEMYETSAQNKRYLVDLVDTLMTESKNESTAEGGKDKFDDMPPDFRHVKWKKKHVFPEDWKLTPERKAAIERKRKQDELAEAQRKQQNLLVDGNEVVKESYDQSYSHVSASRLRVVR